MIRKITLLFLLLIGLQQVTYAQPICAFESVHQEMLNSNSSYSNKVSQFNTQVSQWMSNNVNISSLLTTNTNGDTVYEIPVVVHVMHTGGAVGSNYNISQGKIDSAIDYLNKVYAANWPGYAGPTNGGTVIPFTFKLAQRDPSCNTSNGVNRIDVTSVSGYGASGYDYASNGVKRNNTTGVRDDSLKRLSVWPNDQYYNIWVVNKIDGVDGYPGSSGPFIAGYAYFPGASPAVDGTVILASQMRFNRQTLPHEIGHAFSIYHTFQGDAGGTTCPTTETSGNCTSVNDLCCDTQPHIRTGAGSCDVGNNTCKGVPYADATAKNFMNYANCTDRFTPDQRDRMIAAMVSQDRAGLISSSRSLPKATTALPTVCTPGITNTSSSLNSGPTRVRVTDGSRLYMDVSTAGGYVSDGATYMDMTCAHQLRLQAGNTYTLVFNSTFFDSGAAYIDYNNDGIFGNTTGERLSVVNTNTGSVHTSNFTVPLTATSCTPIRMRIISDRTTNYLDSCSDRVHGQTEDYEVLIFGVPNTNDTVTIANPPGGGNPSCIGTTLTFRATPSTGTTVIGYQWIINSSEVSGATADSLQGSTIFNNNDTVSVKMFFATACGFDSVISNKVVVDRRVTIPPAVGLLIDKGTNPTCVDDTITFKADLISNPGPSPTFQWRSNGVNISGATGQTFDAYNRIGEEISVIMYSSAGAPCAIPNSAISDTIKIRDTTKRPIADIALTIGTNPGCVGQNLQFTATPQTGGTNPTYQWTVNGTPVTGANGTTFNTATLNNNDLVRVIMTSNSACAVPKTVVSDSIKVIHQKITADITIAQTTGGNPACQGKSVIFSANTTNAGNNPSFQWLLNGIPAVGATSPIYVTDSLRNNMSVQCVLIANDPCVDNPLDTSAGITMLITPSKRPSVSVKITAGKNPGCLDSLVEFTATPTDLGSNPAFEWIVNGFPAGNGSTFSTSSLLDSNIVLVRANQTDNGCYLPDTVYSQPMVMKRSTTPNPPVISLIGNKLYTNFDSSFVWFGPSGQLPDGPKGEAYPGEIGPYWAVTNNNGCWSEPSNILRITLLDISSIDMTGVDIYPNPTSDKVIIDWNGKLANYTIDILNATGQVVGHQDVKNETRKEISLGGLAKGNYFLLLKDAAGKVGVLKVTLTSDY